MSEITGLAQLQALDTAPQKPINETRRLIMLIVATAGSICVSLLYAFNLISGELQTRYDLSQSDISTITAYAALIQYFSLPYAFIYDYFGPVVTVSLAMTYFSVGATLFALSLQGVIHGTVLRFSVFYAIMGSGCALFDLSSVVTIILHFPTNKGAIMALLKPFTGLGSAIVGCIYLAFFTQHVAGYFYFLTSFAVLTGVLCLTFLRLPPFQLTKYLLRHLTEEQKAARMRRKAQYLRQRPPMRPFYFGLTIICLMIIYLPLQGAMMAYFHLGNGYAIAFAIITIALCIIYLFLAVPFPFLRQGEASSVPAVCSHSTDLEADGAAVAKNLVSDTDYKPAESGARATADAVPETEVDYISPQYETSFLQSLCRPEVWLMWWTCLSICGADLVVVLNASYILGALSGEMPDTSLRTLLTVLNGAGSAMGRLIVSYYETKTQSCRPEERLSMILPLYFPNVATVIAYTLFLTLPARFLPIPYVFVALSNGFLAASIILVSRTIFAKDPARFYTFMLSCGAVGTIVFNRFLYGEWYSRQAKRIGDGKECLKRECILMPMLVLLACSLTGCLTTTWLHIRYRRFSRMVLRERAQLLDVRAFGRKDE